MKGTSQTLDGLQSAPGAEDAAGAARWFHRFLEAGVAGLSVEELADWAAWSEVKSRLEQVRKLDRMWTCLRAIAKETGIRPSESAVVADEYDAEEQAISEWIKQGSRKRRRWSPGQPLVLFLGAVICFALVAGVVLKSDHVSLSQQSFSEQVQSVASTASEHRSLELSDGSRLVLGARTQLTVHYTSKQRLIFLDHGEASFSVTDSSRRPFSVFAGGGSITALGTRFNVRREVDPADTEHVVVSVSSGSVEVRQSSEIDIPNSTGASTLNATEKRPPKGWAPFRLVKGQELTYSADGPQGRINAVNLEDVSAWEKGQLIYRHTPLRDVIPRVNRYSGKLIVLADDGVANLIYSGTVFEGQVEGWLHALTITYPIELTETDDHYALHSVGAPGATTP